MVPPDSRPCATGGTARIFSLDPITGGAPNFGVFDSNQRDGIDKADKGYNVKSFDTVLSLPQSQSKKGGGADGVTTDNPGSTATGALLGGKGEEGEGKPISCDDWLNAGGLDTSIPGFDYAPCLKDKPRISWRQLK